MSYRVNRDESFLAAAYAVAVLTAMATREQPLDETASQYAQRHLDKMVAEDFIREEKS